MIDEVFLYLYVCLYLGHKALAPESGPGANLWPSYRLQLLPTGDFSHSTTRSSLEPYHLVLDAYAASYSSEQEILSVNAARSLCQSAVLKHADFLSVISRVNLPTHKPSNSTLSSPILRFLIPLRRQWRTGSLIPPQRLHKCVPDLVLSTEMVI